MTDERCIHVNWDYVKKKIADAAIAKLGYHKKTTGYGNNKAVWIYKNVEL